MKTSISRTIFQSRHAIENAMNHPELLEKLSLFNYGPKTLKKGRILCEQANLLHLSKQEKYGSQYDATDSLEEEITAIKAIYDEHVTLANLAFKGKRGMLEKLQLNGPRKRSIDEWMAQAIAFYSRSAEIEEAMGRYGISPEVLNQSKAMAEALFAKRQQQMRKRGEAQSATQKRDEAIQALNKWMSDFRQVARVALQDNPQLLEALGIKVPSRKLSN